MNKILVQAKREWIEFRRDRLSLALAFLLPLFSLILFGYGIRLESQNIPMVVQDYDNTSISREYIERLYATNILTPAKASEATSPSNAIDRGLAKVAVIVPKGFTRDILRRQTAQLQVMIDGTDISNSQIILNSIKAANTYFVAGLKAARAPQANVQTVVPHLRVWFNPGREETLFIVPGVFGIILWMFPALLSAVAISREKEQETIVRVYSSKMSALQFLLGKAAVYFAVGMGLALSVIVVGCVLFGVRPLGDLTPLLLTVPIYVLTSVLFGLFLGTYASSQTTAVQATSTGGFFPCLLLSGFVYPINNIPFPLSLFSMVVPARYFIELSRDSFVRGTGWPAVWQDPLILSLFVFLLIFASWFGLRRMQLKD